MRRRWMWVAGAVLVVVLAGGGLYYTRGRTPPPPQRQTARDPGLLLVLAIRTLEREPGTRLSREQIAVALPVVRALKDVPASDAEAAAIIAGSVRRTFTPPQRAALAEAARRLRERLAGGAAGRPGGVGAGPGGGFGGGPGGGLRGGEDGPAPGGPPGAAGGAGPTEEQRAQFRARAFERMIRYLERRMNE